MAGVNPDDDRALRRARPMNLMALGFFITALLALGGFHLLPWDQEPESEGWHIWPEISEMAQSRDFSEPIVNIGFLTFPSFALLAIASPFLIGVLRKSRLAWWLLMLFSGGCFIALGAFAFAISAPVEPAIHGPGFYWLIAALMLNFFGMLFVRRDGRGLTEGEA